MGLLDERLIYSPFEYPVAQDFWLRQQLAHWVPDEVNLDSDINDWKHKLSDSEKQVIGKTLKGFTQIEVLINNYWATRITKWFKKPEIQMVAVTFAAMESVHTRAYALLQESLGINDFDSFLYEPAAKARIDRLLSTKEKSVEDIARSLAIFSAFNEGVSLFSSFAILLSFGLNNRLKGIADIISWSILDEQDHSSFGCWLFRQLIKEYPEILTDQVKEDIYESAKLTVKLEDDFIDQAFSLGSIDSINDKELKTYIRYRTNSKLKDLKLNKVYKNINKDHLDSLSWFSVLAEGGRSKDFFAGKVTSYSKGIADFSNIWN